MSQSSPLQFGVVLYEGFQLTDVSGPVDVINVLSSHIRGINLALISESLKPISTMPTRWPSPEMPPFTTSQSILPTHTFQNAPELDVLIVPGGMGCFDPSDMTQPNMEVISPILKFVKERFPKLQYLLTVCTGSGIVSLTGLLDNKEATTFKGAWPIIPKWRTEVNWAPQARWVEAANIWSSSGVCSGTDLMFAFVKKIYGEDIAKDLSTWMEYQRHEDASVDPFGIVL